MEHVYESHAVHVMVSHRIFCPRRRRNVLAGSIHHRLHQRIQEVAEEHQWSVMELAMQPDHVHVCIRSNPSPLPTEIARLSKGRSAHLL